ncbi:MAG: hypothetical protein R3C45_22880 [Phycisphaerales bacterium]
MSKLYKKLCRKSYLFSTLLLTLFFISTHQIKAQTINVRIQGYDYTMSNGWGGNCGNKDCGGFNEPDYRVRYNFIHSGNTTNTTGQGEPFCDGCSCGWRSTTNSVDFTNISGANWVRARVGGREDDSGLSGSHDGNCLGVSAVGPQPTINSINPCNWSGLQQADRNNCSSDNVTQNYHLRWQWYWAWNSASLTNANAGGTIALSNAAHANICNGGNPAVITSSVNGLSGVTYTWQQSVNGGAWSTISGATGNIYDPPALGTVSNANTTYDYRRTATYCRGYWGGGGNTTVYSNTIRINVVPDPDPPTATKSPNVASVCIGQALTLTSPTKGTRPGQSCQTQYEYRYSTNGGTNWSGWTTAVPTFAAASGVNMNQMQIRVDNANCLLGCDVSAATTYYWTGTSPVGDPNLYGSNIWHVYGWRAGDASGGGGAWSSNYAGYYTTTTLGMDTRLDWGTGASPSDASTYLGCYIPPDYHSASAKRQGFPCKVYEIDMTYHDDRAQLFVNGTNVFDHNGCCDTHDNIWVGALAGTDQVEVRYSEGGGGAGLAITLTDVTTPLLGGSIGFSGYTTACTSYDPPAFTNSVSPSGGTSAAYTNGESNYQWQTNPGSGWVDIFGANAATYDAPNLVTNGTYQYRRRVTDKCGTQAFSNTISITIVSDPSAPSITKSPNVASVCAGQTLTVTPSGGSGGVTTCTNEYRINTGSGFGAWSATVPSVSATVGTTTIESRRNCNVTTCGSNVNSVSWTVVADPSAPTATKSPNVASVCAGQTLTLTGVSDNGGGTGTCTIEYQVNGAGAWSSTLPSFAATVGTNSISVRKNCNGSGCDISPVSIYSWTVVADPSAPTATKSPNVASVCAGQTLTLTGVSDNGGGTGIR